MEDITKEQFRQVNSYKGYKDPKITDEHLSFLDGLYDSKWITNKKEAAYCLTDEYPDLDNRTINIIVSYWYKAKDYAFK